MWLKAPTKEIIEQSFWLLFPASNNEAEYEAMIVELHLTNGIGVQEIETCCDSQLIVNQFNGKYESKDQKMETYLAIAKAIAQKFTTFKIVWIPQSKNDLTDSLAALVSMSDLDLRQVIPVECIKNRSIRILKKQWW